MSDRAPTVLFVCVSNNGKSVMAEALMRNTAGSRVIATSAGTRAKAGVNAQSVAVLAEHGIDVSAHTGTQLTDALVAAADLVIVLGTAAHVDSTLGTHVEVWDTDEPSLRGIEGLDRMRLIRDDIAARISDLAARLVHRDRP